MPPSSTGEARFPPTTAGTAFMADITAMDAGAIQAPSGAIGGGGSTSGVGAGSGANRTSHSSLDFRKDFFFRRRHGALNWRKVLSVDLERVVRQVDVDALQDNVEHLTFCDVGEADLAMLTDANFLQLYRLTQLIVEYLLNVQNFLLASAQKKEAVHAETARLLAEERARGDQREEEARSLRREVKYCRRVIRAYERSAGAQWSHMAPETTQQPQKCAICGSAFVNYEFLRGHYSRRHPGEALPPPPPDSSAAAATAAVAAGGAAPAPTAQDFATWKREMEATLRAQLADEARHAATSAAAAAAAAAAASTTQSAASKSALEESELAKRLAHMESTLAAVLAHTKGPDSGFSSSLARTGGQSHARGLRDDDGAAASRLHDAEEDPAGVKEYVRRQMFDLVEDVRALKEGRTAPVQSQQQQPQPSQQLADMQIDDQLSPRSSLHAQELLQRYRPSPSPSPARSPHPPEFAAQVPLPQGVGTVPRHVPYQHLAPVPPDARAAGAAAPAPSPAPAAPSPTPIALPSSPRSLRSLRELILAHSDKRYELFATDLPGLCARWPQSESALVSNLNSFAVIGTAVAEHGDAGLREIEAEISAQGYDDLQAGVEAEADDYVRAHWSAPPELLLARRALLEREARNEALCGQWAAQRAREAEEQAAFVAQRTALESAVLGSETRREQQQAQLAAAQAATLAQAQADEKRMADQLREAHDRAALRRAQEPGGLSQPQPQPPLQPTQQPPTLLQQQQQLQQLATRPPAINPYPTPTPSGSPSVIGTPRPYPSPLPALSPSPSPVPAQSPASASGLQPNYSRASSLTVPQGSYSQHPSASPTPTAASSFGGGGGGNGSGGPLTQRQAAMRRPGALRTMEEEDDSDYDESQAPALARSATGTTVGAGPAQNQQQQQQQYVSKAADGSNHPWTPPPAVPVPIPARPLKSAIAAASSAATSTYTAGSLPPRAPGTMAAVAAGVPSSMASSATAAVPGPDAVEAFVPSGSSANSSPVGGMRPRPSPHASPVPSMDQVQQIRNPVRRLAAAGDVVEDFNASSDDGDIFNRRSPHAIAAEAAAAAAAAAASNTRRGSSGSGGDDVEAFGMDDDGDDTPLKPPAMRVPAGRSLKRGVAGRHGSGGVGVGEHVGERGEVLEYEHSTARQDREPGPEHEFGGLDDQYEDKDQLGASGTADAHHFSPAMGARRSLGAGATIGGGGSGRLHSDDEGDVVGAIGGGGGITSRFSGPGAPTLRTRQMGSSSASNPPINQSTVAAGGGVGIHHSRFLGPPVGQSAQFSVASSGDWKSDNDIMDDDLEELIA